MTVDIAKVLAMVESSHRMLSENLHILRGQTLALQRNRVAKSRISKQCQGNKSVSRKRTCRGPLPRQQYKILSKDKTIQVALSRINVDYYSSTSSRLPTISSRSLSSSTLSSEVKGGTRRSLRVGRRRQEHNDRRGRQRSGCNNNNEGSLNNGAKPHLHLRYYASCGHQVSYAVTSSTSEDSYGMCVCATPPNYNTFRFRSGGGEMGYYHGEQHQQTGPVLQPRNENANSIYDNVGGGEFSGFYGSMATREVRYRQNREEYDGFCESCDTVTP